MWYFIAPGAPEIPTQVSVIQRRSLRVRPGRLQTSPNTASMVNCM